MPFQTIRASLTVPTENVPEMHEVMENAVDQAIIRDIPVFDTEVTDECADTPKPVSPKPGE